MAQNNQPLNEQIDPKKTTGEEHGESPKNAVAATVSNAIPSPNSKGQVHKCRPDQKSPLQVALEAIAVLVGIAVLIVYVCQLSQMIEANDINRDILIIGQRAWLGVNSSPTASFVDNGDRITITLKNFGQSPALRAGYTALPFDYHSVKEETFDPICKGAAAAAENANDLLMPNFGNTVFPSAIATLDETESFWKLTPSQPLAIVGCIAYVDQFRDSKVRTPIHFTKFCFNTERPLSDFLVTGKREFLVKPSDFAECHLGHMAS